VWLGWSYVTQIWVYRALVVVAPLVVFFVTRRVCRGLQAIELVETRREEAELAAERAASTSPAR
jgi:TRAP-type C4-dicarboxylate transport system permease small subunit